VNAVDDQLGLKSPLQPHQQRVVDKLRAQQALGKKPGLLVAHGLGSGKGLSAIASGQALGLPIEGIMPAPLVPNFEKELHKHLGEVPEGTRLRSYEAAVKDQDVRPHSLAVMDEAHRARNAGTGISKEVADRVRDADARLLLTATPIYNQITDVAPLLNTAAGHDIVPSDPTRFRSMFVGEKRRNAGLIDRIRGLKGEIVPTLKNRRAFIDATKGYVDVHRGGGADFPDRIDEEIPVQMSPKQWELYKFHEDKMPWFLRAKIRAGLPMTKAESKELNAFQGGLRQVSNTPRPYVARMTDADEVDSAPKLRQIVEDLVAARSKNPNHKGVIYSNYLEGGLLPLARMLAAKKVPHAVFHGGIPKNQRGELVKAYNEGRIPNLLVSSSGTEGLDLKGTRSIQLTEPHWNDPKLDQVIGRGIRYRSHSHLPENERNVRVMRYFSEPRSGALGRLLAATGLQKKNPGIERYMQQMSGRKTELAQEFMDALQEASDAGPLEATR